jgi:hypothetical protein
MATSFSGGGSWSTRREPPTMGKQLLTLSLVAASRVHPFSRLSIFFKCNIAEILLKVALKHQKSNQI